MKAKLIFMAFAVLLVISMILMASNIKAQQAEIRRLRQRVTNIEIVINQPRKDTIFEQRATNNKQRI